ncbi:MAG: UDP-N-acetylmuramoyl-tripeptide--D-alanyl-D-alanine ligase [Firmicutes bacterium]|nr:UDP-N-acetylmuramoyl-tripeptide--D-alanyl-D-alanine ligase [Bacillota bacterium]
MPKFTLEELLKATGGRLLQAPTGVQISGVSIDSRTILPDEVFIALRGEKFDGHDFLAPAVSRGASALVVEQEIPVASFPGVAVILVPNTLEALGHLARYHRQRYSIPLISITGSNGKTTTKELIAAVLAEKLNVVKTEKNYNNEIGLPLSLLRIDATTQAAVLEMGMRGRGEIAYLAGLAQPTIGVITNVGVSHLELLGSQEAIAEAKAELIQALPANGTAVLNRDDPLVAKMADACQGETLFYSLQAVHQNPKPDLFVVDVVTNPHGEQVKVDGRWGKFDYFLPLLGRHNIANSLAAVLVGLKLGLTLEEISNGLKKAGMIEKRLRRFESKGIIILDDTYNASPASVQVALEVLSQVAAQGRKIAVLGDMLELGELSTEAHYQIGVLVAEYGCAALFAFGPESEATKRAAENHGVTARHFFDKTELWTELNSYLIPGDVVLVKGSRGMRMEEIVEKMICGR